jgi:hypothetical protein
MWSPRYGIQGFGGGGHGTCSASMHGIVMGAACTASAGPWAKALSPMHHAPVVQRMQVEAAVELLRRLAGAHAWPSARFPCMTTCCVREMQESRHVPTPCACRSSSLSLAPHALHSTPRPSTTAALCAHSLGTATHRQRPVPRLHPGGRHCRQRGAGGALPRVAPRQRPRGRWRAARCAAAAATAGCCHRAGALPSV